MMIFAFPALVFTISLSGLVLALLFQGWPDALSALAAGSSLFALGFLFMKQR
ncbi:MAG: hypothetical protein KDE63_11965 [Novosphingobium sp.]|jgi:uncharacterized membrane protein YjjP (DUF1212 family)|uniref:hypothetical protein n=1 Tax=Hyphomonas sp. TaxID=87 RepID=UPI001DF80E09|nr:hypothetical protein [Novosphingobium sp.]